MSNRLYEKLFTQRKGFICSQVNRDRKLKFLAKAFHTVRTKKNCKRTLCSGGNILIVFRELNILRDFELVKSNIVFSLGEHNIQGKNLPIIHGISLKKLFEPEISSTDMESSRTINALTFLRRCILKTS